MRIILSFLAGYILGNIQTSYILGRVFKGEDIRKRGEGNAGASNALLSYGWKFGVAVAVTDILKAYVAMKVSMHLNRDDITGSAEYYAALGVFMGHCHPFIMRFRGGKGTACILGVLAAMDMYYGLAGLAIMVAVTFLSGYIVIAAFSMMIYYIYVSYALGNTAFGIAVVIGMLSVYYHIPNLKRISRKKEKTVWDAINGLKK